MNWKKVSVVGVLVLVLLCGLAMASSTPPKASASLKTRVAKAYAKVGQTAPAAVRPVVGTPAPAAMAEAIVPETTGALELIAPPEELHRANSHAMSTSVAPMAPMHAVAAGKMAPGAAAKVANRQAKAKAGSIVAATPRGKPAAPKAASMVQPKAAQASAAKPKNLFSYVRLLNYSPHPQEEVFLKNNPLVLKDRKYHFSVKYDETWKVLSDDLGHLNALGFNISILEGDKAIRVLKVPAANINVKTLKKGQILGIAEVAPYTFKIAVDSFAVKNKGVTELTFRMDVTQ